MKWYRIAASTQRVAYRHGKGPALVTLRTKSESVHVATPIYYVNAEPHIGHLYSTVLADAIARWQHIRGQKVIFSTGTDEHGLKVELAAAAKGLTPNEFCNVVSARFKLLFKAGGTEPTAFLRTTEAQHIKAVQALWVNLHEQGYIYKGVHEGWYSIRDEAFVPDNSVIDGAGPDGNAAKISSETGAVVTRVKEENYKFRLSSFGPALAKWLETPSVVFPPARLEEARKMVKDGLPDISVSRLATTTAWGIAVPGDTEHTVYVWLDALANYLTVAGYVLTPRIFNFSRILLQPTIPNHVPTYN